MPFLEDYWFAIDAGAGQHDLLTCFDERLIKDESSTRRPHRLGENAMTLVLIEGCLRNAEERAQFLERKKPAW